MILIKWRNLLWKTMEDVKIVNTVNLLVAAGNGAVHGTIHWKTRINSKIVIAIKNAIKTISHKRLPPGSLFFCKQISLVLFK